jgi:hypothetical protein
VLKPWGRASLVDEHAGSDRVAHVAQRDIEAVAVSLRPCHGLGEQERRRKEHRVVEEGGELADVELLAFAVGHANQAEEPAGHLPATGDVAVHADHGDDPGEAQAHDEDARHVRPGVELACVSRHPGLPGSQNRPSNWAWNVRSRTRSVTHP